MGLAKGVGQLVGWLLFVQLVGLTLPFMRKRHLRAASEELAADWYLSQKG